METNLPPPLQEGKSKIYSFSEVQEIDNFAIIIYNNNNNNIEMESQTTKIKLRINYNSTLYSVIFQF